MLSYIIKRLMACSIVAISIFTMSGREMATINDGWTFAIDSLAPTRVNLPHTWNSDAYTVKEYRRSTGVYTRTLTIPKRWDDKRIFLKVDAASKASEVYIDSTMVGSHQGGYTAHVVDITPYISTAEDARLRIEVDNRREDVPPISADFTFMGGIYRDVWLIATDEVHFSLTDGSAGGVYLFSPQVSDEEATISVRSPVTNDSPRERRLLVTHEVFSPDGQPVGSVERRLVVEAGATIDVTLEGIEVHSPRLWSPESPQLYRVVSSIIDTDQGRVLDSVSNDMGLRYYSFDGDNGFMLNGKPYKLRGMCRHQDRQPIGVALSDEMHRHDIALLKEMGANFIRISHYPQDDAILEMCDRLGLLAWEEIPVIDRVPDTEGYGDACEQSLREMIRQHFNHPSVILWGYMNEILLRTPSGDERPDAIDRAVQLAKRLETVLKEEDPFRLSTMAFHGSNDYNSTRLSEITDVVGWNLYQGWYGGDMTQFEQYFSEQHRSYPHHPIIVSEYGAGSDRRLHSLSPQPFDFSSEYQQLYLEHYLSVIEDSAFIAGASHWNLIDFSSALRDESMPRINNKGILRVDREPKDVFYYYQAAWRQDIPVLHIASRDWSRRAGVIADGVSMLMPVKVYTNLAEVAMKVDGKAIGCRQVENYTATFMVPMSKDVYIEVEGIYDDRRVADAMTIDFAPIIVNNGRLDLGTTELGINAGSNCYYTSSMSHLTWLADQAYTTGGAFGYVGGSVGSTQTEIHLTADGPLYQTYRKDIESYRFDLIEGRYEIEISMADTSKPAAQSAYLLGRSDSSVSSVDSRFSIAINGNIVEENLSPAEAVGYCTAMTRRYIATTDSDGHIKIDFTPINGSATLAAIKIRKL